MNDLLWLLLPLAAASGWLAARRSAKLKIKTEKLGSDYFQGLNFLLNEQADKAIDAFVNMMAVDEDTFETHLALGSIYRRRGEVDRAIRIHQNLIARISLSAEQRSAAILELGRDYMRAGLLDRAEVLFQELVENDFHVLAALQYLLDIYQQEKDWNRAIDVARGVDLAAGPDMRKVIAQLYCEQAEQALQQGQLEKAHYLLDKALLKDKSCVRASLLEAKIAVREGDHKMAIVAWQRIESQDIDFIPEVLPGLRSSYQAMGDEMAVYPFLERVMQNYQGVSPVILMAELIEKKEGIDAAIDFITQRLQQRASVRGLEHLLKLGQQRQQDSGQLLILQQLVEKILLDKPTFRCNQCGFSGKTLHWQCPGCREWNTVKPIYGVEGE
ncbi:MAG: lipopolysaccharide assembly protein LapB [Gammaproteobacteria bacterium]|nr:lipopolysaccharide assembly protein LapB [Gammaproteobacteria bacterium]